MVFIVLVVSTIDCDSIRMGSNPIKHPKYEMFKPIYPRDWHFKGSYVRSKALSPESSTNYPIEIQTR